MALIVGRVSTKTYVEALESYMGMASVGGTDFHMHISKMDLHRNQWCLYMVFPTSFPQCPCLKDKKEAQPFPAPPGTVPQTLGLQKR